MVVIGSSFIGLELVAAVSKRGLASIDVIGLDEVPFEAVLGKVVGAGLMKVGVSALSIHELVTYYQTSTTNRKVSSST